MSKGRRRLFKQTVPLEQRLASFAEHARVAAQGLPAGVERDDLLKRVRRADTAANIGKWINSAGLQPPKR